jgi:GNAT superfamily N-acetyltransferase
MQLQPLDSANPIHLSTIVSIWNAACGHDLSITPRFAAYNLQPAMGAIHAGCLAVDHSANVGFVLCSALPGDPATSPPELGWMDAVAVLPEARGHGAGSQLVAWAEDWLRKKKCTRVRLGGSLRPFVAGYPVELGNEGFFRRRGFGARAGGEYVWDVARDLGDYASEIGRPNISPVPVIRPAQMGDEKALLEFLQREFPGRWRFKFERFLRSGGRLSDWMVLLSERGVDGFARLTFEDSLQPLERFHPQRLPRPWGQLGPIGVSKDRRGQGYGAALLDACLQHLRGRGVRGCVIDWTELLEFYAKFGFTPYRQYAVFVKTL